MRMFEARLAFSIDEPSHVFPNAVFHEPPAAVSCWEQQSDGRYRLTEPRSVHWDPQLDRPNLMITCTPAKAVLVRVFADEDSVTGAT